MWNEDFWRANDLTLWVMWVHKQVLIMWWYRQHAPRQAVQAKEVTSIRSFIYFKMIWSWILVSNNLSHNFAASFQTWSCWASWFSSPSTIEANLSLFILSAAIVMAARILSKLGENRPTVNRPDTRVNKLFYHLADINPPYRNMLACPEHSVVNQIRMFGATWSYFKLIAGADRMSVCAWGEIFFAEASKTTWNTCVFLKSRLTM